VGNLQANSQWYGSSTCKLIGNAYISYRGLSRGVVFENTKTRQERRPQKNKKAKKIIYIDLKKKTKLKEIELN
jgi:hypothetical protein